ncbi:MAG TPA: type IV pilin protein [Pseudomonadales bacterium]|nr:type IV pilin protein [Pseudomonadales bacterium]
MNVEKGFTLIELMIVVAIIAIISAIAYPSYQDSVRKSNRSDAMDTMLDTAQRMERCYSTYGSYNNASCPLQNGNVLQSPHAHYRITLTVPTATTYSLTATQLSAMQLKDTKCVTFVLDNTGRKTATGTDNLNCW